MTGEMRSNESPDLVEGGAPLVTGPDVPLAQDHPSKGDATPPMPAAEQHESNGTEPAKASVPPLSKNQQKRLKRKQEWAEGRDDRKAKRKEKMKQKKERKRAAQEDQGEGTAAEGEQTSKATSADVQKGAVARATRPPKAVQLPITFVFDCQFDELMTDGELVSLGAQLTRSYSDNRKAKFRAHMVVSSFGGRLKERFEGVLARHHESWKGVRFLEEDFVGAAAQAEKWMKEPEGGKVAGALAKPQAAETIAEAEEDEKAEPGEIIYLSSDSSDTLTSLKPNSTYIIGGLVDRNRHKGICHKRAVERGIRTAKLPIGELMQMSSRQVLATNHVAEIMVRWLECGDWGKAFMEVIPKRKGGILKEKTDGATTVADEEGGADDQVVGEGDEGEGWTEKIDATIKEEQAEADTAEGVLHADLDKDSLKRKLEGPDERTEGAKRLKETPTT